MSKTMVVAPIIGALVKSEDILGKDRDWNAINGDQSYFLERFFAAKNELPRYSDKELRSWVSWVASELNEILKKEGFDIQLKDFDPRTFGVVSILDVLVEWLAEGSKDNLRVGGVSYPAVRMKPAAEVDGTFKTVFEVYSSPRHRHPIVVLHTKSGDKLYMTVADGAMDGFRLTTKIDEIRGSLQPDRTRYTYLRFPMVDLNQEIDISWLIGMWTGQDSISQALQQTKFKMNQLGARVKSAVAIAVTRSVNREVGLDIDQPFYLWIERDGVTVPVMYAYLDQEDWKNPGNLSEM